MIGLGSNRLSVCRRGGMSVTQAGRGGMEWLAGGRRPRWSSPYSAHATAALKAQFPTQWPTIRDYGFSHPEIVGYMNAYAPEDAKIAYSLVEGIGTRWLKGDGTAYIETGHIFAQNEGERYVKFKVTAQSSNYRYWGSYRGGQGRSMMAYPPTGKLMLGIGDGTNPDYQTDVTITVGSVYEVWMTAEGTTANYKVWKDGTLAEQGTYTYGKSIVVQDTEPIFCDKENGTRRYLTPFDLEQFETKESGSYTQKLVPFVLGTARTAEQCSPQVACAVGTIGLLNLADGIFMPNANSSGSFTISETPAS